MSDPMYANKVFNDIQIAKELVEKAAYAMAQLSEHLEQMETPLSQDLQDSVLGAIRGTVDAQHKVLDQLK
jgi:hypothetical protein